MSGRGNGPDWALVRRLFEALVDLSPSEAERALNATENDPAVRDEVRSLLAHHSQAGTFLESPPTLDGLDGLAPGTALGPYAIVREISSGGMGRVYLARDVRLNRQVCVKAVRPDLVRAPGYRERLQREAQLAASLNHPGICAVHALESFDDQWYLITEFVDGQTLREEIASAAQPSADLVMRTMRELADALRALHDKGIVHRDVKPENIMRAADGRLKVLDFGLARSEDTSSSPRPGATLPGAAIGTLAYMAPEQINGQPLDRRADLFALGVVVYEYATGVHPFAAPSSLAVVARILEHEAAPLQARRPDIAPSLAALVGQCLQKDPANRPTSAGALLTALYEPPPLHISARPSWWRVHQVMLIVLYLVGCLAAWRFNTWTPSMPSRWAFLGLGLLATVSGMMRGHLLFTERAHPSHLAGERRRTRWPLLLMDLAFAASLFAAAALTSAAHPVWAVLAIGLSAAIAITAVLIEPATSHAAFGNR